MSGSPFSPYIHDPNSRGGQEIGNCGVKFEYIQKQSLFCVKMKTLAKIRISHCKESGKNEKKNQDTAMKICYRIVEMNGRVNLAESHNQS